MIASESIEEWAGQALGKYSVQSFTMNGHPVYQHLWFKFYMVYIPDAQLFCIIQDMINLDKCGMQISEDGTQVNVLNVSDEQWIPAPSIYLAPTDYSKVYPKRLSPQNIQIKAYGDLAKKVRMHKSQKIFDIC